MILHVLQQAGRPSLAFTSLELPNVEKMRREGPPPVVNGATIRYHAALWPDIFRKGVLARRVVECISFSA